MADLQLIVYPETQKYPQRQRLQHPDVSYNFFNAQDVIPSVIGKYRPTEYKRFRYNYEDHSFSSAAPANVEAPQSFIAKYRPTVYRRFRFNDNYAPGNQAVFSAPDIILTDDTGGFLLTTDDGSYFLSPDNIPGLPPLPPTGATATLVIAYPEQQFYPQRQWLHNTNDALGSTPLQAGATATLVMLYPEQQFYPQRNWLYNPDTSESSFLVDTGPLPHFIGKYQPDAYKRFRYNVDDNSGSSVPPPDLPIDFSSFIAKYVRRDLPYRTLLLTRQNTFTTIPQTHPKVARTVVGYPAVPLWQLSSPETWINRIGDVARTLLQGRQNITLMVTLASSGATTTTITDPRISINSGILLVPQTANAAAIYTNAAGIYVSAQNSGTATLTHASNSTTDATFLVIFLG